MKNYVDSADSADSADAVESAQCPQRAPMAWRWLIALLLLLAVALAGRTALAQEAPAAPQAPILATTPLDFQLPGTQPGGLSTPLISSQSCGYCHVPEIVDDFAGSMMANAARDPLFRAALQVANQDAAGSGELCLRCHTPNGWLEGRTTPTTGSDLTSEDLQGVSCSLCHRLVAPEAHPGEAPTDAAERAHAAATLGVPLMTGSSAYVVDREDVRRGPFPPENATHSAAQSTLLRSAELCATCHDIDNPTLTWNTATQAYALNPLDTPAAAGARLFPVERTYSEWEQSAFNTENGGVAAVSALYPGIKRATMTPDGPVTVCQDCHMPLIESPLTINGDPARTVGRHQFAGGSALWQKGIAAFWSQVPGDTFFDATPITNSVTLGEEMLARAATLEITMTRAITDDVANLTVKIINNTGHKLPTGYAEGRRMWLEVRVYDASDTLMAVSGMPTATGGITNPGRIYEIKQGITTAHAQALGRSDLEGEGFHFILNNKVFKDNRIPPRGWNTAGYAARDMLPVGATYAAGQYWNIEYFVLPAGARRVDLRLLFQAASDEYLDFLAAEANIPVADGVVGEPVNWGQTVADLRAQLDLDEPVVMASATRLTPAAFKEKVYLPAVVQE